MVFYRSQTLNCNKHPLLSRDSTNPLLEFTSILPRCLRSHIFRVTFATSNFGVVTLRATVWEDKSIYVKHRYLTSFIWIMWSNATEPVWLSTANCSESLASKQSIFPFLLCSPPIQMDSSVGTATRLRAGWLRNRGSIPGRKKRVLGVTKTQTHLHCGGYEWVELYLHFPTRLHGVHCGTFTFPNSLKHVVC